MICKNHQPQQILLFHFSVNHQLEYPSTQFVLSEFRKVFRTEVNNYQEKELIVENQSLRQHTETLCVCEIVGRLTYLLYQRLRCYAAGLDIDLISDLSATAYESKSPEGETIVILPSLKWLEKDTIAVFEPLDSVVLEHPQLRALRKQLNICGKGALAIYKDNANFLQLIQRIIRRLHAENEWLFLHLPEKPACCVPDKGRTQYRIPHRIPRAGV